jgi:hypothetical protein
MRSSSRLSLLSAAALSAVVLTTGCNTISAGEVRRNMTPALDSAALTDQQVANRNARIIDNYTRTAWDDLANILLLDDNMHLSPYPFP